MSKEQVDVDALFKADGSREKLKKDLAAYHEISVEEASEILDKADADEITETLMEIAEEVCKVSWNAVNHANGGGLTFYM
jgi:NTP pyrophosphatase (non-canonical NTP hydrolase)